MLRLLARTVYWLWKNRPADAFAIHPHHIDPSFGKIRDEITDRLKQEAYIAAQKADVASLPDDPDKSLAETLDATHYAGQTPITQYIARTAFLHTLAYGEGAQGISPDALRFAVCSPAADPSFIEQARKAFIADSIYLDDRPNVPMRFMTEPNINQVIRRETSEVKPHEVREELLKQVQSIFSKGHFEFKRFPAEPYEVPDEIGNGDPILALIDYATLVIEGEPDGVPDLIRRLFLYRNSEEDLRRFRNNAVFLVADLRLRENMEARAARRLALGRIVEKRLSTLAEHQQKMVKGDYAESESNLAIAVQQCFRHLFFPASHRMHGAPADLEIGYTAIEIPAAAASPGNGQSYVEQALDEQKKLIHPGQDPPQPGFVRDKTQLKIKGALSTADFRNEFRRSPKLAMLLENTPFILCVRKGIDQGIFIYREDSQFWGPGDTLAAIHIDDNAFVHTIEDAKAKDLWPRPEPLTARLRANPSSITKGAAVELTLTISGGRPPYTIASNEPSLLRASTHSTTFASTVKPDQTFRYETVITDKPGVTRTADSTVTVAGTEEKKRDIEKPKDEQEEKDKKVKPVASSHEFKAEGTLSSALAEIWSQARAVACTRIDKMTITLWDAPSTWKVHGPMATERSAEIECRFEGVMASEGVRKLSVAYDGQVGKAAPVKSFLEPLLKTAAEKTFESMYTLTFAAGLPLGDKSPEKLAESLTRMGGGEAYVEAWASAPSGLEVGA